MIWQSSSSSMTSIRAVSRYLGGPRQTGHMHTYINCIVRILKHLSHQYNYFPSLKLHFTVKHHQLNNYNDSLFFKVKMLCFNHLSTLKITKKCMDYISVTLTFKCKQYHLSMKYCSLVSWLWNAALSADLGGPGNCQGSF